MPSAPEADAAAAAKGAGSIERRTHFPAFPYQPYSIQREFMAAVYARLQAGGVGLFESPTGPSLTSPECCAGCIEGEDGVLISTPQLVLLLCTPLA